MKVQIHKSFTMNKQNIYLLPLITLLFSIGLISNAQNNTLLTIGDQNYSVDEFNYIFNKNNSLSQNPLSKEEYVPLFVNYKLKVLEAIDQGYDTIPTFKNELEYYRNELAKPYLTDKKATEAVIQEAYDHLSYDLNAYHILIKLPQSPSPEDTLAAYNKIVDIKSKITDLTSFEEMARKNSDCPSSAKGGDLGYFTGFMMVYPFEEAAYKTEVGQVSDIVRTSFGYHIIYIKDKRENQGEIKVAHIMKMFPQNAPQAIKEKAKTTIDSLYQALLNGADFTTMVKEFSDDKNSLSTNGELPWFSTGRMVPEFAEASFALSENDQISEPIQTPFGWHIIKRIDHKPMKSLEESREEILQKIKRDERAYAGKKATLDRLKKEYKYSEDNEGLAKVKSIIEANKDADQQIAFDKLSEAQIQLASFTDKSISSEDFSDYLTKKKVNLDRLNEQSLDLTWKSFAEEKILDYEKSILEDKYPEFHFLMNEYHDGLLIFEISQAEIWNKASEDTTGLQKFFAYHKDNYRLKERFEGTLFFCNKKKDLKKIQSMVESPEFNLTDSLKNVISTYAKVEEGEFNKGEFTLLDQQVWGTEKAKVKGDYKYLIQLGELKPAAERELNEVRGQVLSDYQAHLEENWIAKLREKYKPKVNQSVFKVQ